MKKRFLVAAIAATMISPIAAYADATVYGNVHLSIDDFDDDDAATTEELEMNNRTSSLGVKGKEDLGGGMTALFKVEFGVNPDTTGSTISSRDQWVGLKGAMGTVKLGTMSSNYKQMGGKIDPMYRTALEGRANLNGGQSNLHGGSGILRGRSTDTVQYTSPKMGGMSMVFNTTFAGVTDETMGLGLRYKTKAILAYFDYIDMSNTATTTESAMKVGGSYKMDALTLGLQYEAAGDLLGADYTFFSANYDLDNANVALTVGSVSEDTVGSGDDGSSVAVMYNHHLSKRTNAYVGYVASDVKSAGTADVTDVTFGLRHKF